MPTPRLEIEFCTQCNWLLRAAWLAQELLTTFGPRLGEVALIPGTGGVLILRLDGVVIFDRKTANSFPEPKTLKQLIRDQVAPDMRLGHSDREPAAGKGTTQDNVP
jgi:selenoprotein W-related protein